MKPLTTIILFIFFTSCATKSNIVREQVVELKALTIETPVEFENQHAIFTSDLNELLDFIDSIKDSDSVKYNNCKAEVEYLQSLKHLPTHRIIEDSLHKNFLLKEFIQGKIENGEITIYNKMNQQQVRSVRIRRPRITHFSTFQVFLNTEENSLIFERNILILSR